IKSVQLRSDGTVLVADRVLRPRHSGATIDSRDDLTGEVTPWIQWYGDLLIIKDQSGDNAIFTYELEQWQQWALVRQNYSGMICRDLNFTRRTGERFLLKGWSIFWKVALLAVIFHFLWSIYGQ